MADVIGTFVYFVMFLVVRVEPKDRRPRDCMVFNRILKYSFADGNAREGTYRLDRPAACRRLFSGGFVALLRPVRRPVRCRPGSILTGYSPVVSSGLRPAVRDDDGGAVASRTRGARGFLPEAYRTHRRSVGFLVGRVAAVVFRLPELRRFDR